MAVVAQQQKGIRRALTEAEVRATVQEAIDDTDDCLISPVWGLINYGAANRHHKRYIAVMGIAAKAASMAKVVFGAGGLILLLLVAMLINSTYPWWTDMLLAALIGGSVAFPLKFMITYRGAFSRIVVHEHRDFTEPSQVTAKVNAWCARLAYYFQPAAWKGDNDRNGISNPSSHIVVKTEDQVTWLEDGDVEVIPARRVLEFTSMADYMNLAPEIFVCTSSAPKERRATWRQYQQQGKEREIYNRGKVNLLQEHSALFFSLACVAADILIVLFQGG